MLLENLEKFEQEIREDSKIEIAKNMLKRNFSLKEISEITGLSIDKIKSLK